MNVVDTVNEIEPGPDGQTRNGQPGQAAAK
jgi:hypothetical protein